MDRHDVKNSSLMKQEIRRNDCNNNSISNINIHKKQQQRERIRNEQHERIRKEVQRLRELSMNNKLKSATDSLLISSSEKIMTKTTTTATAPVHNAIKPIIIVPKKPLNVSTTNHNTVHNHINVAAVPGNDEKEQVVRRKQQQSQLELIELERKPNIKISLRQREKNYQNDRDNTTLSIKSDKLQQQETTSAIIKATISFKNESNTKNSNEEDDPMRAPKLEHNNDNCNVDDVIESRQYPRTTIITNRTNNNGTISSKATMKSIKNDPLFQEVVMLKNEGESFIISTKDKESYNRKQIYTSSKQHIITTASNQLSSTTNYNNQYHEQRSSRIKNIQQDEQEVTRLKLEKEGMMINHRNHDKDNDDNFNKMNQNKEWEDNIDYNDNNNDDDDDMDSTYRPSPTRDDDDDDVDETVGQDHNNNNRKRKIDIIDSRQQKKISLNKQKNALKEYNNKIKDYDQHDQQQLDDRIDNYSSEEVDDNVSSASTNTDDDENSENEIEMGKVMTTIDIASTEQPDSSSTTQKEGEEDVTEFSIIGLLNTITFDPNDKVVNHIVEISPPSPPFNVLLYDLFPFQKHALGFMYEIETTANNHRGSNVVVTNANQILQTATTTAETPLTLLQAPTSPDVIQSNVIIVQQSNDVHPPPHNQRHHELNIGAGWLANEPGMGKTVVAIALICSNRLSMSPNERTSNWKTICDRFIEFLQRPSRYETTQPWKNKKQRIMLKATVIITSNSLLGQWEDEFAKYAPSLQIERYHPPSKKARTLDLSLLIRDGDKECSKRLSRAHVIMTTATMKWPDTVLNNFCFHRVIMDEAHLLGKSGAACYSNAKPFKAKYRWCITSSPMSTSLLDLEKQAEFLGFMNIKSFAQSFRVCKDAFEAKRLSDYLGWDTKLRNEQFHLFANVLKQVMIRQKAITLPQFSSMSIVSVKMNRNERLHYLTQFQDTEIQKLLTKYSTQSLGCPVVKLQTLLIKCAYASKNEFRKRKVAKLGQFLEQDLNEHRQANGDDNDDSIDNEDEEDNDPNHETRYGMKVVIFTVSDATHSDCFSYIKALDKSIRVYHLDGISGGGADRRDEVIRRFQLSSTRRPAVLICTWKKKICSGVLGISLTKASKIYFMEPWIDPTMEEEATRRIRRIGQQQNKNVSIVKFVYDQTFEQNIISFHRMIQSRNTSGVMDGDDDDDKVRIRNGVLSVEAIQIITKGMLLDNSTINIPNASSDDGVLRLSHNPTIVNKSHYERLAVKQETDDTSSK